MKIWHTTVSVAVLTTLLVYSMAWPYDESKPAPQAKAELQDLDYPVDLESQESDRIVAQNLGYYGEEYHAADLIIIIYAHMIIPTPPPPLVQRIRLLALIIMQYAVGHDHNILMQH